MNEKLKFWLLFLPPHLSVGALVTRGDKLLPRLLPSMGLWDIQWRGYFPLYLLSSAQNLDQQRGPVIINGVKVKAEAKH